MKERNRFIKVAALPPDPTPNPKLKLSRLSEGLRKELKPLLKEGKGKMSLLPEDIRKRVIAEMAMPKLSSGTRGFTDKGGNFVPTGSHMGRGDSVPVDKSIPAAFEIESIMDRTDKAYDKEGAYWGHLPGEPVYRAYAELPDEVEFERNGYSDGMQSAIEMFFRAKGMRAAKMHVKSLFPNATFIPRMKEEGMLEAEGQEPSPYDPEKMKLLWTLNRDSTGKTFAQFEALCHELFGKGWPSGMPPDIADTTRVAKSPEEFVAMVEKNRAEGRAAVADFDRTMGLFNSEPDPSIHEDIDVPESRYPELQAVVDELVPIVSDMINQRVESVESSMPYKAQWVLEELIKELQSRV